MIPPPIALALTLCEKAVVEEGTKNLTLVNTFTTMFMEHFPSLPQRFALYAALTDGLGDATIELVLTHLETDHEIRFLQMPVRFLDRLSEVRILYRLNGIIFPQPGRYQFSLFVDGDWIAQRRFQLQERGQ